MNMNKNANVFIIAPPIVRSICVGVCENVEPSHQFWDPCNF